MNTRYTVGEQVVAVLYVLDGASPWFNPLFRPWEDKLREMRFKTLTVTEHHKVAWDQDPNGDKQYDGFLLQEADGQLWANQYPTASYGQVSTSADYYFNRSFPPGTKYDGLPDEQLAIYEDVTTVIDRIKRGIDHFVVTDPNKSQMLQIHLDWLIKKIQRVTGAAVVFEPIWKDHPDIVRSALIWKD